MLTYDQDQDLFYGADDDGDIDDDDQDGQDDVVDLDDLFIDEDDEEVDPDTLEPIDISSEPTVSLAILFTFYRTNKLFCNI